MGLDESAAITRVRCLPGNWKVISDGFSETYHVQGLHREMLPTVDDVNGPQHCGTITGSSNSATACRRPFSGSLRRSTRCGVPSSRSSARVGVEDKAAPAPPVPPGQTLRDVLATMLRDLGRSKGVSYDRFSNDQLMTMQQYNLFPNVGLVIFPDMMTVLRYGRGRLPTRVPRHDALPPGAAGRPPPARPGGRPASGRVKETGLGLSSTRTAGNIDRARAVSINPASQVDAVSREECRILNMHRNLELWLGITPTEITGD